MPATSQPATTGSARLDQALVATGFRWSLDQQFKVIDITGKLQHRLDEKLNPAALRQYVNMFKAGSTPPPVGVTRDGVMVWGNHRTGAARNVGQEFLPAIVIDVDGRGADEHLVNQLLSCAYAENTGGPLPYSNADRLEACKHLVALGYSSRSIQMELGLSAPQVSGVKREVEASKRLDKLGINVTGSTRGLLKTLGGPDAKVLNDEPFKKMVALTKDANLTASEINALAKDAKAAGSDSDALVVISTMREEMEERIAQVGQGGSVRPTPIGRLKGALRNVIGLCDGGNPSMYKDHGDDVAATVTMLEDAIRCLTSIKKVQEVPTP